MSPRFRPSYASKLESMHSQTSASHQHWYAQELTCKWADLTFKRWQHTQSINTPPLSYLVALFCPHYLSDADGAFVYAPMHVSCQACRFWLHTGNFRVVALSLQDFHQLRLCAAVLGSMWRVEIMPVSGGNWWSVLCASNAIGAAIPGDLPASSSASYPLIPSPPYPSWLSLFTTVMLYSAQFTFFLSPLNQPSSDLILSLFCNFLSPTFYT